MEKRTQQEHGLGEAPDRVVAFADAIFAFAATLLVVDLRVPEVLEDGGAPDLGAAVRDEIPQFFAYALSFVVIGLYWQAHRRAATYVVRGDGGYAWLTLAYLALVAFLPYPTATFGRYEDARFAVVFYAAANAAIGAVSLAAWLYATQDRRLVGTDLPESVVRAGVANGLLPVAIFLASIAVAFVNTAAAPYVGIGLALAAPLRRRFAARQ